MKYSFKKGLTKSIISAVVFYLPILVGFLPAEWMNMTIGGVLALLVNFVKVKYIR